MGTATYFICPWHNDRSIFWIMWTPRGYIFLIGEHYGYDDTQFK